MPSRMARGLVCFMVAALGLLACAGEYAFAAGDDVREPVTAELVVGVETIQHYPYYGICGIEFCGFAREMLDAFARDNAYSVHYLPLPIARLHRALVEGRVDLKFPANPDWAPDIKTGQTIRYSNPVVDFVDGVMTLGSHAGDVRTLGTIRGFTLDLSHFHDPGHITLIEANTDRDLMNLLFRGRVDGIYSNIAVVRQAAAHSNIAPSSLVFRTDLPHQRSQYYLSSNTKPVLIVAFNAWIASHGDQLEKIRLKYGLEQTEPVPATAAQE